MSQPAWTTNRRQPRGAPSVSLFPFLAVLICTMGALVPLLLAVTRQARLQAVAAAREKARQQSTSLSAEQEGIQWKLEQLRQSRMQTEGQLTDRRLQLGHLEDHSRRLRDQIGRLEATWNELQHGGDRKAEVLDAELKQVEVKLTEAQRGLADARETVAKRPRSYAIIPYDGPNQTRRRPIYIECCANSVVLQPEGVTLRESDFEGPSGPGNPLAMAVRATREYLLAKEPAATQDAEPYPFLLVRPDGIEFYGAARQALESWSSDFGYELIDDDWKLAYQKPDADLARVVSNALQSARQLQDKLIAAAPSYYGSRWDAASRGAQGPGGGSNSSDDDASEGTPGSTDRPGGSPTGYRPGGSSNGSYLGGTPSGSPNGSYAGGTPGGNPNGSYLGGTPGGNPNGSYLGGTPGGSPNGSYLGGTPGGNPNGSYAGGAPGGIADGPSLGGPGGNGPGVLGGTPGVPGGTPGVPGGTPGGYGIGGTGNGMLAAGFGSTGNNTGNAPYPGGVPGGSGNGSYAGGTPGGSGDGSYPGGTPATGYTAASGNPAVGGSAASGGAGPGQPGGSVAVGGAAGGTMSPAGSNTVAGGPAQNSVRPDGFVVGRPYDPAVDIRPASTSAVAGTPLRPGEWYPTEPPPPRQTDEEKKNEKRAKHVSADHSDWGLPEKGHGSVAIGRPIQVECYADRLVIVSQYGPANNKIIPLRGRTASAIDPFISAIWAHMGTWGIAGRGMYWRPMLQVSVAPEAEQRYAELVRLLDGSGLTVERR